MVHACRMQHSSIGRIWKRARRFGIMDVTCCQIDRYVTQVDNFEWAHGFEQKFGLYSWEPDNNQTRTLLPSSRALAKRYADAPEVCIIPLLFRCCTRNLLCTQ